MNTLTVNGTALAGIYIDASQSFNKPEKRSETFAIPGRSGDLLIDEQTFANVVIPYPCYERGTFPAAFNSIVNMLSAIKGYMRIQCSNDPTHYRLGRFIVPETPTAKRVGNKDGYFNLSWDCKPQRYLTSGETAQTFTASGTITNPTRHASQPLIRVYGTGKLTVGDVEITIARNTNYIDIDCELMDCFRGTTNLNADVTFSGNDFPVLNAGGNNVTLGSGITQAIITPRWWEL